MKNPNGYGSIYKLSGKRRNPYRVMITTGYEVIDDKAVQKRHTLGYYPTRQSAMIALAEYNRDPYKPSDTTLGDLFEKWIESYDCKESTKKDRRMKFSYTKSLQTLKITELSYNDIQNALYKDEVKVSVLPAVKTILRGIITYAQKNGYRVPDVDISLLDSKNSSTHFTKKVFTKDEVEAVWSRWGKEHDVRDAVILVLLYTGCRVSEILKLDASDVHKSYFHIPEGKTDCAERDVPITHRIAPIFDFLLEGGHLPVQKINDCRNQYLRVKTRMGKVHTPHECRHSFITRLVEMGKDERYIKAIVGHTDNNNVTRSVYTHIGIEKLCEVLDGFDY